MTLEEYLQREYDKELDKIRLTEYPCLMCGLMRLYDLCDHHVCRQDPQHEFVGFARFLK